MVDSFAGCFYYLIFLGGSVMRTCLVRKLFVLVAVGWSLALSADPQVEQLFNAVAESDVRQVVLSLESGVDVNASLKGFYAIMLVEDVAIARLLIDAGARVDVVDGREGQNALHWVIERTCDAEVAEVLIEEGGADPNATAPATDIFPPLTPVDAAMMFCAMGTGDTSVIEMLLDYGGDGKLYREMLQAEKDDREADAAREQQRKTGTRTPLHAAVDEGTVAEVVALIEAGADVHAVNKYGETPLHIAAGHAGEETGLGAPEKGRLLIEAGANIEAIDKYGSRPLHILVDGFGGDETLALLQILIDAGVDVNSRDDDGYKPLFKARHYAVKELLQANGAE